ncbi:uclacyanin-3 [Senna tora]|uniref:Uclacyanin-3 n=1 Tax=Senna tora TaxID=362788 RepID=A0A834T3B8_9FABA|nr:uclacyanin-3 [Senna tora]
MAMAMGGASLMLVLLLVAPTVYSVDHTVGGSSGWSLSGDYATWAAGETFTVGDSLVFTYDSSHGVARVSESDYNSCTSSNAIQTYSGGNSKVSLSSAGKMYFICPTPGHCTSNGGMKLAVNVVAAASTTPNGGSSPPATPSPPSSGSTPATTTASPPPPAKNGAVSGFGHNMKQLMGTLFVSWIILGLMC